MLPSDPVVLLETFLRENGRTQRELALACGLREATISRIINRIRRPGIDSAAAIERATDGAVPASAWVREIPEPRRKRSA
jgi:transcriptional regulator with XRE-family HTH domain